MTNFITAGFQNTVDFELEWDQSTLESLIRKHQITNADIGIVSPIRNQRDLLCTLLCHMLHQSGSECLVVSSQITRDFAAHFSYHITLGGTAVRAAMAIEKIGYRSTIHVCSLNRHFCQLIPTNIHWLSSVPDEGDDFHPHVICQYPAGVHIRVCDIDFVTQCPNRVIFTHDPPSTALHIADSFKNEVRNASVLLIASFNIIKDENILLQRLNSAIQIIQHLPQQHVTLMEDGCFENPHLQQIVAKRLAPYVDVFSMNEDELQDRLGRRINILDPKEIAQAICEIYKRLGFPTIICHSAYWALAYGKPVPGMRQALEAGICMASTRFRLGDSYDLSDYVATMAIPSRAAAVTFSYEIENLFDGSLICVPGKDLDHIVSPTTIGLGDSFIGGMLPCFLTEDQRCTSRFQNNIK